MSMFWFSVFRNVDSEIHRSETEAAVTLIEESLAIAQLLLEG